jgi:hypothetical protein
VGGAAGAEGAAAGPQGVVVAGVAGGVDAGTSAT